VPPSGLVWSGLVSGLPGLGTPCSALLVPMYVCYSLGKRAVKAGKVVKVGQVPEKEVERQNRGMAKPSQRRSNGPRAKGQPSLWVVGRRGSGQVGVLPVCTGRGSNNRRQLRTWILQFKSKCRGTSRAAGETWGGRVVLVTIIPCSDRRCDMSRWPCRGERVVGRARIE
jgi:hypothetical protein